MQINKNEDGSIIAEQAAEMNQKSAQLLIDTFQILSALDIESLQSKDESSQNDTLNEVAKKIFKKITEQDILPVYHEQLGEATAGIIQTVFYKVKQIQQGVERGLIEHAMGVAVGVYEDLTLKEMTEKLSEVQK